ILPGESISKYRQVAEHAPATPTAAAEKATSATDGGHSALAETFPQDEPLFAEAVAAGQPTVVEDSQDLTHEEPGRHEKPAALEVSRSESAVESPEWDREQKRRHEMNVAAVFGGEEPAEDKEPEATQSLSQEYQSARISDQHLSAEVAPARSGTLEEEEIDEEEDDLASYVEDLEEDAAFDEFEEETHAAGDRVEPAAEQEIAASVEDSASVVPFSAEPVSQGTVEVAQAEEEVDDAAEDEAELEEGQAEAEALLAAEAVGNGTVGWRAEVRAAVATVGHTQ